jgi:hypothetical protein
MVTHLSVETAYHHLPLGVTTMYHQESPPCTTTDITVKHSSRSVGYEYRISVRKDRPEDATPNHPNLVNKVFITVDEWESAQALWELSKPQLQTLVQDRLQDVETSDLPDGYRLQDVEDEVYLQVDYEDTLWTGPARTVKNRYLTRYDRRQLRT